MSHGSLVSPAALTTARAAVLLLTAAVVLGTARLLGPAVDTGAVSGPMAALVLLVPLALADVLLPLAEAGSVAAGTRAARDRFATLAALQPAVIEPSQTAWIDHARSMQLDQMVAGWDREPVLDGVKLVLEPGDAIGVTGP